MADWTDVALFDDFSPGSYRTVEIDDVQLAGFNLDGAFHAIEDVCTHDYECLTGGDWEGDQIACPRHGARFSITSGEALTPPAYEAVATFPVRIENGMVQVRDDRWD